MNEQTVYIVHAIDAEGPLAEKDLSLHGTKPTQRDFWSMPDFSDIPDMRELILKHRSALLPSWEEIMEMLRVATSEKRRFSMKDSFGGGWIYNWHCLDHVGFVENPRRRIMGMHQNFDFYSSMVKEQNMGDEVHWHFHPMSTYRVANKCATSYLNSPELFEILCRRVIERKWFPRVHRAGFQDERPDSHWFLEQWIPFDISNTSTGDIPPELNQDLMDGRFSDWRWAPDDWRTYHPSHDCYQREGNCRRVIGRCLNLLNRFANLDEPEMLKAFKRADSGKPTLVGLASHDFRDLNIEVEYTRFLIQRAQAKYPKVKFKYASAIEAFNAVNPPANSQKIKLDCRMIWKDGLPSRIVINPVAGKVFGPQPFLAIKTRSNRHIHDNLNFGKSLEDFNYQFDDESVLPDDVRAVGVVANDAAGNQSLHVLEIDQVKDRSSETMFLECH